MLTPRRLREFAAFEDLDGVLGETDPQDASLSSAFTEALERPLPMDTVEFLERAAKALFNDVFASHEPIDDALGLAFINFFHALGFLFKYKPYGVKIASPFGYSIFDLHDGMGFSFQLHKEPKLEAFHILRAQKNSFVYLSTEGEWLESGRLATGNWVADGNDFQSDFAFVPSPGDVIRVSSTELVHSVVGCTLEEYATTSVDAVERLFDQNNRVALKLPVSHPNVAAMLQSLHPALPDRLIVRSDKGWASEPLAGISILDVADQLAAARVQIDCRTEITAGTSPDRVIVVVPVTGPIRCQTRGRSWLIEVGGLWVGPPGWDIEIDVHATEIVAVHSISKDLVLREWAK